MRSNKSKAFRTLHWLLRGMLPKHDAQRTFFVRVFIGSAVVHVVAVAFLFLYQCQKGVVHISRQALVSPASIVYVPWVKRFNQLPHKHSSKNSSAAKSYTQVSPVGAGFIAAREKKYTTQKAHKKKKEISAHKKQSVLKKQAKHEAACIEKKTKEAVTPKHTENKKNTEHASPIKKEAPKKVLPKAVQEQPAITPVPVQKAIENQISESNPSASTDVHSSSDVADEINQPIYIGRDEKGEYELVNALLQDIKSVWKPPVGFVWNTPCVARVSVDGGGVVREVVIEQSSGIVVVDISVRRALEQVTFNSSLVYGKKLILSFER